jgi:ABC-2 type transport system permease protein
MLVWFVMLFLGGAGPPPEVLTGAMQTMSDVTPLWHAVLGLRFFRWE